MKDRLIDAIRPLKHFATTSYSTLRHLTTGRRYRQLVVCGFPRSGTSLLYNMLSTTASGFDFEEFEVPAAQRIHRLGDLASKNPLDVLDLERLPTLNIHSKEISVLIVIRDPRDLVTSRHPVLPQEYFIGYDHSWWPQDLDFNTWKYDAPGILDVARAIEGVDRIHGFSRLIVRYEDLVEEPDAMQHEIGEHFGLEFTDRFSRFHEHGDKMAYNYSGRTRARDPSLVRENDKPDSSRAGKWRRPEYTDRITEQFSASSELLALVRRYGYEPDDTWFDEYRTGRGRSGADGAAVE